MFYNETMKAMKIVALLTLTVVFLFNDIQPKTLCGAALLSPPENPNYTFSPCTDAETYEQAALLIMQSLSVFGDETLKRFGVDHIAICENLVSYITPVAGLTLFKDNAVWLIMNADYVSSPDYFVHTLYHELYHAWEYKHPADEAEWALLCPIAYTLPNQTSNIIYYDATAVLPFEPSFISAYAKTRASEDRSELFSAMLSSRGFTDAEKALLEKDAYIQKKLAFITQTLPDDLAILFRSAQETFFSVELPQHEKYVVVDATKVYLGNTPDFPFADVSNGDMLYSFGFYSTLSGQLLFCMVSDEQRVYVSKDGVALLENP